MEPERANVFFLLGEQALLLWCILNFHLRAQGLSSSFNCLTHQFLLHGNKAHQRVALSKLAIPNRFWALPSHPRIYTNLGSLFERKRCLWYNRQPETRQVIGSKQGRCQSFQITRQATKTYMCPKMREGNGGRLTRTPSRCGMVRTRRSCRRF
jgi:hypothetical protein